MSEEIKDKNEKFARHQLIEELFYDLYENRRRIYWMNFLRGLFFGLGTLVGGTLIVAIAIWALSQFTNIFPSTSDYIKNITESFQKI
ncbi:MAG: DUF5665 domain-containing protein [Candidatus Saccharibacteria bacterium]